MPSFLRFWFVLSWMLIGAQAETPQEVKFMAYNLKNYVRIIRGAVPDSPKPEKEIAALISIIVAEKPDILGVCEMGPPAEFADFLARLKKAGLDYAFTEHVEAYDTERHLAFASRFPISARNSQTDLSFDLDGKKQYFKRGILDVTVAITPSYQLRFVGTHLKSKRDVLEDQMLIRRNEARLLRLHTRAILDADPNTRLALYGDLNDTIDEAPIRDIMGNIRNPDYLFPIPIADDNREKWTHFRDAADTYTRIDYVMLSRTAHKDLAEAHIPSPANWNTASDHRPLVVTFKVKSE